jgi:4-amino-4-deoxy-L-arabinose transferase-like glycosyltransferase
MSPPAERRAAWTVSLAGVLLLAAALRLGYLIVLWRSPLFLENAIPGLDMATYLQMATTFAQGRLPEPPRPFFQAPLYPLFLAAIMRLVPEPQAWLAALTAAQVPLGTLACGLVWRLGRELISAHVALVAALLYALYPLSWYYGGLLLVENLLVVLLLGLALASARALATRDWRAWLAVGVLSGLATAARGNLALVLPVLLGLAALRRPPRAVSAPAAALALGSFGVLVLPAVAYNSLAAGSPQFVSGQGEHLWLAGNTAFATGLYQLPCGPALLPVSVDFWVLQGHKLLLFLSNEEFGNNTYVGIFRGYLGPRALPPVGFGVLAGLGVLGCALAPWLGIRRFAGPAVVLGVYAGTIVLLAIVGRYRLPAAALLCVPAAAAVVGVPQLVRRARRRTLLASAAVVVLMVAANVALPYDVSVPFAHANAAAVFGEAGDQATAEAELAAAHAARLEVEARDGHGCAQLPAF